MSFPDLSRRAPRARGGTGIAWRTGEQAGKNKVAINVMWTLIAGFLVMIIFCISWAFFKVVDVVMGNRVATEVELEGLDVPEMGVHGYPEVQGPRTVVRHLPSADAAFGSLAPVPSTVAP